MKFLEPAKNTGSVDRKRETMNCANCGEYDHVSHEGASQTHQSVLEISRNTRTGNSPVVSWSHHAVISSEPTTLAPRGKQRAFAC